MFLRTGADNFYLIFFCSQKFNFWQRALVAFHWTHPDRHAGHVHHVPEHHRHDDHHIRHNPSPPMEAGKLILSTPRNLRFKPTPAAPRVPLVASHPLTFPA